MTKKSETKRKNTTVKLSADNHNLLEKLAERSGLSRAVLANALLASALKNTDTAGGITINLNDGSIEMTPPKPKVAAFRKAESEMKVDPETGSEYREVVL